MKLIRLFSLLIVFCFCLSYNNVYSASSKKSEAQAEKIQKSSSESQSVSDIKKTDDEEKQIWLNRVKGSEIYTGKASWYGRDFHNKKTASGINYDMYTFTAAHRTLPMGTVVKVTDQNNGKSVMVCITDRGPYVQGRIIDLSYAAAQKLNLEDRGVAKVALEVMSDEQGSPLKSGHAYYVKYNSDTGKKEVGPYNVFADAAAMHEAIRQAHPDAEVVMEDSNK